MKPFLANLALIDLSSGLSKGQNTYMVRQYLAK